MKGLVSFVLAAGLSASSLCAVDSKTLSQSDKEFLFAANEAKTQVLSEQEMSETDGEFFPILIKLGVMLAVSTIGYLNAPAPNDPIYSGKPPF
mgnify:CR=1 FL=1